MSGENKTERRLLAFLAETSVHPGTGAQLGAVDLPIQRERHTEWPTIYGSGIKGVLRDHATRAWTGDGEAIRAIFGPETEKGGQKESDRHAGALAICDARLLLFPVRTGEMAFAWITCPMAIARFLRDAAQAGMTGIPVVADQPTEDRIVVAKGWPNANKGVLLEEFDYQAKESAELAEFGKWIGANLLHPDPSYKYWSDLTGKAIAMVSDSDFRDYVRYSTDVVTRVKLGEGKTVERGALWTEEHLPSDTLLYSFAASWTPVVNGAIKDASQVMERLASLLTDQWVIRVGGKETVGHGFVSVRVLGGGHV